MRPFSKDEEAQRVKRPGIDGGFLLCFGLNLILNGFWIIPAIVLFITHFVFGTPIWLAWLALILWIAAVFGITAFMSWAASTSNSGMNGANRNDRVTVRYSSQQRADRIDMSGKRPINENSREDD